MYFQNACTIFADPITSNNQTFTVHQTYSEEFVYTILFKSNSLIVYDRFIVILLSILVILDHFNSSEKKKIFSFFNLININKVS